MSSLTVQSIVNTVGKDLEHLSALYSHHVLPYLQRRSKASYIAAAVALYVGYQVYNLVHIPRKLQHIPAVPFWAYMRSVLSGRSTDGRLDIIYDVVAKSPSGVYLKPNRGGWSVGIVGPQALKTMFIRKDNYPKSNIISQDKEFLITKLAGSHNILALNGTEWKKHRMIANPAFHRHMPVKLFGTLCERLMKKFEIEGDGLSSIDVPAMMQRFTLDAIGLAGFDYDFQSIEEPHSDKVRVYNSIMDGFRQPIYFFFPFLDKYMKWAIPQRRQQHMDVKNMTELYQEVIDNKRKILSQQKHQQEDPEKDLLTLMIEAGRDDPSQALSDEELSGNLAIFFIAGHDTTSNALSFALYYLAVNPDVQEKARKEVIEVMGDGADIVYPTHDQLPEFKYIYMIIKETLRLCPPAQNSQLRLTEEDSELAGTFIPKNVHVQADIFAAHHNPAVWKDAEQFRPERFAPGGENEQNAKSGLAWTPFGNGARQCIGMNFSLAEQRVVLAMLLRKYTWSLPENSIHNDGIVFAGGMALLSPRDLYLKFQKRF
ncbi:hypothetical protein INT43_006326 [Umbelopsis isabellina]|uniref:Cytochrome P450 n=1 Tax=Mortierella isabellina TaxID=91625 RepID=A0A8H7UF12_MORIS|nr:hypothetical protein INT43_006326 [Umbelopsis isabellina]